MASSRVLSLTRAHRLALLSSRRWLSSPPLAEVNPCEVGMISGIPEQHLRRRVSLCFVYCSVLLMYLNYLLFIEICISDLIICWLWRIQKESNWIHALVVREKLKKRLYESNSWLYDIRNLQLEDRKTIIAVDITVVVSFVSFDIQYDAVYPRKLISSDVSFNMAD